VTVAAGPVRSYVSDVWRKAKAMSENAANADTMPNRAAIFVVAAVVGGILAGTIWLWAHYGTAIFFETIRAGLVACFG
jgi:hypothetical protein